MPEFTLMPAPVLAPGRCLGCGGHSGPVVDLMIRPDDPAFSMYLCERCVVEAARLVGCLEPETSEGLVAEAQRLAGQVQGLEDQLEWERANKVVAVSDMAQLIDRMRGSTFEVSVPAEIVANSSAAALLSRCTETRVDGSPCTAEALPGRDVCLAHSKRKAAV